MNFQENLKFLRKSNGISQKKLADTIGVAQSSINYWEKGKRIPSIEAVQKLADYFNVSLYELLNTSYHTSKVNTKTQRNDTENLTEAEKGINKLANEIVNTVIGGNSMQDIANSNTTVKHRYEKYIESFKELNDEGQKKAVEQVELLAKIPEYRKKDDTPALNAAHDNGATSEQKKNADDIMKNPDEWN